MSKRHFILATSICIAAGLVLRATHSRPAPPAQPSDEASQPTAVASTAAETHVAMTSPSPSPSTLVVSSTAKDQVAIPPTIASLREEVKKDPHSTPHSLLRFAADLGVRMKAAKTDNAEAQKLLGELTTCVTSDQDGASPVQARALCLVTARELAQQWPDMHDDVEKLVKGADPEIAELATKVPGFAPKSQASPNE